MKKFIGLFVIVFALIIMVGCQVVEDTPTNDLVITLANTDLTITTDETLQLEVLVNGNVYNGDVKWFVEHDCIASVDENGLVSPFGSGKATVSVTVESKTVNFDIIVEEKTTNEEIASLELNGDNIVIVNKEINLTVVPDKNVPANYIWSTNNWSIVSIDNGIIKGLKEGLAIITVSLASNPDIKATKIIEVTLPPITDKLTVSLSTKTTIYEGTIHQLDIVDSNGKYVNRYECEFISSNPLIAAVNESGLVHALKIGSTTITVKYLNATGTINLTISEAPIIDNYRNTIIDIAIAEDGYKEIGENGTKYGEWYGWNNVAWCAIFVSWAANQAGVSTSIIPKYASVQIGLDWYRNKGPQYYKSYAQTQSGAYTPITGDIVFFKSNGASHTGLVVKVVGDIMYTIEGNTSNMVRLRYYYYKNYDKITGYGIPNYPESTKPIKDFDVTTATLGGGSSTL